MSDVGDPVGEAGQDHGGVGDVAVVGVRVGQGQDVQSGGGLGVESAAAGSGACGGGEVIEGVPQSGDVGDGVAQCGGVGVADGGGWVDLGRVAPVWQGAEEAGRA